MVDRKLFTEAMRHVAQSVTVVTTKGKNGAAGATVSAFSSLSADPPSVLICLRSDSRIEQPDRFGAIKCVDGPSGAILDGATAFECALEKIISHGSHDICIGNVTAITHRGTRPLAYMDGSFQIVRPVTKIATE